jgi:hypothetical protein
MLEVQALDLQAINYIHAAFSLHYLEVSWVIVVQSREP